MAERVSEALRIERIDATRVRLSGALGFAEAGVAYGRYGELFGEGGGDVELDLAGLQRVDSATLAVLLGWAARAATSGRSLRLSGAPSGLLALAHLCQVEPLLGIA